MILAIDIYCFGVAKIGKNNEWNDLSRADFHLFLRILGFSLSESFSGQIR